MVGTVQMHAHFLGLRSTEYPLVCTSVPQWKAAAFTTVSTQLSPVLCSCFRPACTEEGTIASLPTSGARSFSLVSLGLADPWTLQDRL